MNIKKPDNKTFIFYTSDFCKYWNSNAVKILLVSYINYYIQIYMISVYFSWYLR